MIASHGGKNANIDEGGLQLFTCVGARQTFGGGGLRHDVARYAAEPGARLSWPPHRGVRPLDDTGRLVPEILKLGNVAALLRLRERRKTPLMLHFHPRVCGWKHAVAYARRIHHWEYLAGKFQRSLNVRTDLTPKTRGKGLVPELGRSLGIVAHPPKRAVKGPISLE